MDRTVKPDPEIHSSAAKSSSLAALHVAKVIASVIPSEPVDDGSSSGICRNCATRSAHLS